MSGLADHAGSGVAADLLLATIRLRARLRAEHTSVTSGQSMSQLSALGRLADVGPVTTTKLAALEHVRQQSMAETVAALRADGLVEAAPDPRDRRRMLLTVTESGHVLVKSVLEHRAAWLSGAIASRLTEEEAELLAAACPLIARLAEA
jgi:DNA-binding MarR family transcriptional regulator